MGGNNTLGRAPRPEYNDQGISTAIYMQLIIRLCNKHRKRKEKKSIVLYTLHICTICYVCFVMIVVGSCDLVIPVFRVAFIGTSIRESLYIYIIKIRLSHDRLIFIIRIHIHGKWEFILKWGPGTFRQYVTPLHSHTNEQNPRVYQHKHDDTVVPR